MAVSKHLVTRAWGEDHGHLLMCSLGFLLPFRVFRMSVEHVYAGLRNSSSFWDGASGPGDMTPDSQGRMSHLQSKDHVFSNKWNQVCVAETQYAETSTSGCLQELWFGAFSVLKKAYLCLPSKGSCVANVPEVEAVISAVFPPTVAPAPLAHHRGQEGT